jgi:hypothetical protein
MFKKEHAMKKVAPAPPDTTAAPAAADSLLLPVLPVVPAASPPPAPPVFPQPPLAPFQYPPMFNPYLINPMAAYLQSFNLPGVGMPGMGIGMPAMGIGMPGMPAMPKVSSLSPCGERSSSPFSNTGGVHGFCQAYGISENEELALDKLGFELGDNLEQVTEHQYEAVGFKTLAWKRVLKAYKKFKRENKN